MRVLTEGDNSPGSIVKAAEPIRALTAVRGAAAWWVVAYHFRESLSHSIPISIMTVIDRGYLAVDLFFVLSGYVIAINYGLWFKKFQPSHYLKFLALRLSRIYPLHGFILVLFLFNPFAAWLFSRQGRPGGLHIGYYASSVFLVQSWGLFGGPKWNVPAWSISTEWLAYLVFPLLVYAAFPLTTTRMRAMSYIFVLLVLLSLSIGVLGPATLDDADPLFGIVRCLGEFSIGLGIARLNACGRTASASMVTLLGAMLCFAAFFLGLADYIAMPGAFALIVYALADESTWFASVLHARVLQWLGIVSYSTYLSHYFLKIWTKFLFDRPAVPHVLVFPIYVVLVVSASALLYNYLEKPAQEWCRRRITLFTPHVKTPA